MKFISARDFTGQSAWEALPIANMSGITTRLHWTDKPYKWYTQPIGEARVLVVEREGSI